MRAPVVVVTLVLCASSAAAECAASGRKMFAAGLDALNAGDLAAATRTFYDLVEAQPDCPEARNNLAVALVEEGRLQEAAAELRHAVAVAPDYERARANLD